MSSKQSTETRTGIERIDNVEETRSAGEARVEGDTLILPRECNGLQYGDVRYDGDSIRVSYGNYYYVDLQNAGSEDGEFVVKAGVYTRNDTVEAERFYYDSIVWAVKKLNELAKQDSNLNVELQ